MSVEDTKLCNLQKAFFQRSVWESKATISNLGVQKRLADLKLLNVYGKEHRAAWLLKAITCIDLTTLGGDDCPSNVTRLCIKALNPLGEKLKNVTKLEDQFLEQIHVAAVCVYPSRVADAKAVLKNLDPKSRIGIASVATGFPTGQYPLATRLEEIKYCVQQGATEIDVVINRTLVLTGKWMELYEEIVAMNKACGSATLKAILAVGECGSLNNVYRASFVAMLAGSDFIKTSTGKEAVNATLTTGLIMCRAIKDFYRLTGKKIGLKPAGGLKTAQDCLDWLILVKEELGNDWLKPELFRIGASSLLADLERNLYHIYTEELLPEVLYSSGFKMN